ncbi:hypothetical protein ACVHYJ_17395 [Burkholderia pyrrocinia]
MNSMIELILIFALAFSQIQMVFAQDSKTNDAWAYDERDVISTATPFESGINQQPVVGVKKVLVSVIHWKDGDSLNDVLIARHTLSSDPDSLRSYILAASNGKLTLDGEVISFTSDSRPDMCKSGSPMPMSLATQEGAKAAEANGLNPADFDYLINVIDCGGNASAYAPGRIMGVYGQSGGPHVYKHEFGHNLGYHHGSTFTKCPRSGDTVTAPVGCTTIGYGDTGDSVSGGGTLYPANNQWFSGWIDASQVAVVSQTGLYRLSVLGSTGPQLYLINRPTSPFQLTLEFRQPTPFDNFPPTDNRVTGVWVRYTNMTNSLRNIQLDATPETSTTADPTLQPGRTLKDEEAGVNIKVCTTDKTGAILSIAFNGTALPYCTTTVPPPNIDAPVPSAQTGHRPVFAGTGWPGAMIDVSAPDNPNLTLANAVVDAHGHWTTRTSDALPVGRKIITARQLFGGKYSGQSDNREFSVIDLYPHSPVIETPIENTETGRNPLLSGTGLPGAHIRVTKVNGPYDVLAETDVDAYGKWSVKSNWTLPLGAFSMTAWQLIDGNRSPWSPNRKITVIDTPTAPVIETPIENTETGRNPLLSGTGLPGAHIRVTKVNGPYDVLAETDVDAYGKWSVKSNWTLPLGAFSMTAWQLIDGNRSPWSPNRKITVIDTPTAPVIETPIENTETGRNPLLSGTGLPGAHIRVTKVNGPYDVLAETDVDAYGKWSVKSNWTLPLGAFSMTAWQLIDGNRSPWSPNRKITVIDTPTAPVIETPIENTETGRNPLLSGTGLPGAHIRVTKVNGPYDVLAETDVDAYGKWSVKSNWTLPLGAFSMTAWQLIDGNRSPWSPNRKITVIDTPLK